MNDIRATVAKNIARLRQAHGMTQLALAERLNYSDKAVSKWERGESLPDITVLVEISEIFSVPLDALVKEDCKYSRIAVEKSLESIKKNNRAIITGLSVVSVWLIATLYFVLTDFLSVYAPHRWLMFLYAVPISGIIWLVMNSIWFSRRLNYLIISVIMWSVIVCLHVTFLINGSNWWLLYMVGIPGQLIIFITSFFKKEKAVKETEEETA